MAYQDPSYDGQTETMPPPDRFSGALRGPAYPYPYSSSSVDSQLMPPPRVTPSPRSMNAQPVNPTPAPFKPATNASALMTAQDLDQQYKASKFNDWFKNNQPQQPQGLMPPPQTMAISNQPPVTNPQLGNSQTLGASDAMPPYNPATASTIMPSGLMPVPSSQTPQSGDQMPPPTGSIRMTNAQGVTSSATGGLMPPPRVGDIGTLRGTFQNHDAQGNPIPGSYRTVDASAPRDAVNVSAIAKDNAFNSPDYQNALKTDPGYQKSQQGIADVKAAMAAGMSVKDYQAQQAQQQAQLAATPKGVDPKDWQAMTPKDRVAYQEKQQDMTARGETEKNRLAQQGITNDRLDKAEQDRIQSQRDARNDAMVKSFGSGIAGIVKSGLATVNKFMDTTAKNQAAKAKTVEQRQSAYDTAVKQNASSWNQTMARIKASGIGTDKLPEIKAAWDANHQEMLAKLYPEIVNPQQQTPPAPGGNAPAPDWKSYPDYVPKSGNASQTAPRKMNPGTGLPLGDNGEALNDADIAKQFLAASGGDKVKARDMAKAHGWKL